MTKSLEKTAKGKGSSKGSSKSKKSTVTESFDPFSDYEYDKHSSQRHKKLNNRPLTKNGPTKETN